MVGTLTKMFGYQGVKDLVTVSLVLAATPLTLVAQERRPDPRTPRPAHERLAVFEGSWRVLDETTTMESCAWMEGGRRHMICRNRTETPGGVLEHRTVYSYRGRDSTYIVTALLGTGQVWTYLGRAEGDVWRFDLQADRPNSTQRLRMVVTVSADTIRFVEESSENDGPWQVTEDYRHVRVRSPVVTALATYWLQVR